MDEDEEEVLSSLTSIINVHEYLMEGRKCSCAENNN